MITDESFKMYSKELNKLKPMNTKREKEIRQLMVDPNTSEEQKKQLRDEIVKGYLRYVISEASKLRYTGIEMVDLIGEGNYGLMKAIEQFDWTSGNKFTTYAYHWIRAQMLACVYNDARMIRLPMNIAQDLHKQIKNLNENNVELDNVMANLPTTTDLFRTIGDDENNTLVDVIKNTNAQIPDEAYSVKDSVNLLLSKLTEREQKIIKWSFGIEGIEMDTAEIAEELKMNKESIRVIRLKALDKMKSFAL